MKWCSWKWLEVGRHCVNCYNLRLVQTREATALPPLMSALHLALNGTTAPWSQPNIFLQNQIRSLNLKEYNCAHCHLKIPHPKVKLRWSKFKLTLFLVSTNVRPILVAQRQRSWSDIYGSTWNLSLPSPTRVCVKDNLPVLYNVQWPLATIKSTPKSTFFQSSLILTCLVARL